LCGFKQLNRAAVRFFEDVFAAESTLVPRANAANVAALAKRASPTGKGERKMDNEGTKFLTGGIGRDLIPLSPWPIGEGPVTAKEAVRNIFEISSGSDPAKPPFPVPDSFPVLFWLFSDLR